MKDFETLKEGDSVIIVSLPESIKIESLLGKVGTVSMCCRNTMIAVNTMDGLGNWFFNRDNLELIKVKYKILQQA